MEPFKKTQDTILEYLMSERDSFTFKELKEDIFKNGGCMRVAPNYTVREYLHTFEIKGKLKYIPKRDEYLNLHRNLLKSE